MKTTAFRSMLMLAGIVFISTFTTPVLAQGPGRGPGPGNEDCLARVPGITEEQHQAIDELRTAHIRKAELIRAEIGEKNARLNTLNLAEETDTKAIDKTIDEISKLRGDLMKEREAHKRNIKALLTDEQKVYFDARPDKGPRGPKGKGNGDFENGRGKRAGFRGECPYGRR